MKINNRFLVARLAVLGLAIAGVGLYWPSLSVPALPLATSARAAEAKKELASGEVDASISRAYIFVGKTGLGHEHAVVGAVRSGSIKLGAMRDAGEIVFDMRTFTADTDEARRYIGLGGSTSASTRQEVTANMLGGSVLDVGRFPTATFKIASAPRSKGKSPSGKPMYELDGKFTLHGVTQPIRIIAEMEEVQSKVHLRGSFAIFQTAYGIQPFSKAFGAVGVTDKLTIHGSIWIGK